MADYNGVKGLGDVVDRITKITGVKATVKLLNNGEDCKKCDERRKRMNKKYPL